jgi:predicted ATPase
MVASETKDGSDLAFPFSYITAGLAMRFSWSSVALRDFSLGSRLTLERSVEYLKWTRFYHIFPDALREPQSMASKYPLQEHGENLASLLDDMKRKRSPYFTEPLSTLGQVVPGVEDISVTRAGGHLVVRLLHNDRDAPGKGIWLDASEESDGTLRTLGLLVALYQDPTPPFIAIKEPELTIHPGALSVLA